MGYAVMERKSSDEIGSALPDVQQAVTDFQRFAKVMTLRGFFPFKTAEDALENINDISEGVLTTTLKACLETNLPATKPGKKSAFALGVSEHKIGSSIQEAMGIPCVCNELTSELLRGARLHLTSFISQLRPGDVEKAQLGLAHSYSRCKVKFDVNRADKHIIQSIAILDTLDKDINTFAMRVREWYSWHFPELLKIVADNYLYARLVKLIKRRDSLSKDSLEAIEEVVMDANKAQAVLDASKHSMGMDISDIDMLNISAFADRVIKLAEYRKSLQEYLHNKMNVVAPNLQALIGDQVGARLISHAGSLTNLSKYPASTVQILGAEKALFRALKTRGNTPKYGLIFHSSFIGRAASKNKGRISRYLANKCSIACRIDNFSDEPTSKFGEKLNEQVEQRLRFYDTGEAPKKNVDAMKEVIDELRAQAKAESANGSKKEKKAKKEKKSKKEKKEKKAAAEAMETKEKKEKKEKKRKDRDHDKQDKSRKTQHLQAEGAQGPEAFGAPLLSEDDYFQRATEFQLWLKEARNRFLDELGSEEARKEFKKFVSTWNSGELPQKYYKGLQETSIAAASRTRHKWAFASTLSQADQMQLESTKDSVDSQTSRGLPGRTAARPDR
uniref:Nucleolar protein 56 n=1 Tax=Chrysotila carterae TaxID=13221 RepID=A0A7S4F674_CHRCT